MPPYGGPIRANVRIVPHRDISLKRRRADPQNDHDPPRGNYWGVESDGPISKGNIDSTGAAVLQANTRWLLGSSSYIYYTVQIPQLNKSVELKLRFNLVKGEGLTRTSFVWEWENDVAKFLFKVSDGIDKLSADGWTVEREARIELSEACSKILPIVAADAAPFVSAIRATPLLPVYTVEKGVRKCRFDSNGMTISSSEGLTVPVALARSSNFLTFDVRNPRPNFTNELFKIAGVLRAKNGNATSAWRSRWIVLNVDPTASQASITPSLQHPFIHLPSGFEGHIEWTVALNTTDPESKVPLKTFRTPLEFYYLPAMVPKYISDGLPAQFLRILLQTSFEGCKDSPQGWVKYCMDFLRSQNFRYETLGGKFSYSDEPYHGKGEPVTTNCYLEHWLSHYDTMRIEKETDRQRRVNCYDLAALGQVMLAIGLDQTKNRLKMKYLHPYGMINETNLIGFTKGKCNNPFFENGLTDSRWDPNPIWTKDSKKYRSGFRNHAFLAVELEGVEKIIDATCGPEVAEKTMEEYIAKAIDHVASQTLVYTVTDDDYTKGEKIKEDGSIKDVDSGDGITSIVSPVDIHQVDPPKAGLIYEVRTAAEKQLGFPAGNLIGPTLHTDGLVMTLSWSFKPAAITTISTIDMVIYSSKGPQINLEYINRKAGFGEAGAKSVEISTLYDAGEKHELVRQGITSLDSTPGRRPFSLWQQGLKKNGDESYGMVVVVDGFGKDETKAVTKRFIHLIDKEMTNSNEKGYPEVTCASGDGKPVSVSKGRTFELTTQCTVTGDDESVIQVVGVDITTKNGNVVYLEPDVSAGMKSLKFTFHARHAGDDEITITYFTTHMHLARVTRKISISASDAVGAP